MAKRRSKKYKRRKARKHFFVTLVCLAINSYVIYSVGTILNDVYTMKREGKELNTKLNELKDEEAILKSEVKKLKNPDYVAKYAREKFFYSGKNEYIIRMK